ncbi:MAG: glutamine synthetase III [Spirochaetia bacterium]
MSREMIDLTQTPLPEFYGENAFTDLVMKERLPKSVYKELKLVQSGSKTLTIETAEVVANAMKDWAIEKGATHYTHWFQPLTDATAEKHDAFIAPTPGGGILMEFSGKELIQGEPDASSFPSGGLRATFEARGYTAWDTTSPAFLKKDNTGVTLYIPTAFVSYTGKALDKKVPLLRSMEAVNKASIRVLRALGNKKSQRVYSTVGAEQEYFLVDKDLFSKRWDLVLTGRTVFGNLPAKGQEMNDHYFGSIKERAADFMRELNIELWKLGISAKTQHNEVAPNQFELATIFDSTNAATDKNQLVMDTIKKVAVRHGMVALLHEKPFTGVNGSGKHNNWSLATDDGLNLLEPGDNPHENAQFLLFLTAVIEAVDRYASVLRASAANAGNDHRLGGNEAPPAIISIFLGEQLSNILCKLAKGEKIQAQDGQTMEVGVTTLPNFPKDLTDRNRTSPFAFTGNKFEFRMVGSSQSIAGPNAVLNTGVAQVLTEYAEKLEKAKNINQAIKEIASESYNKHNRVVFNGNGYSTDWVEQAEKRGLPNITSTVEALKELTNPEVIKLFETHQVLTKAELESRQEIYLENYSMKINIEASITIEMAQLQVFPAASKYAAQIASDIVALKNAISTADTTEQEIQVNKVVNAMNGLMAASNELREELNTALATEDPLEQALAYRNKVVPAMEKTRVFGDNLEWLIDKDLWPFPRYEELLFHL